MFFERAAAKPVVAVPGVMRRTIANGQKMMICEFTLDEGAVIPSHSHPHEQVGYVVSGKIELTVGDEAKTLCAGDSYSAPGEMAHSVIAREASVVVDTFSPPRTEYLP